VWCRQKSIGSVIDLELFSRFTALLSWLSGAKSRIGFSAVHDEGLYRGRLINFPVRYNPHVHIGINFLSLVNTALGSHDTPYPTQAILEEELTLAKAPVSAVFTESVRQKIKNIFPDFNNQKIFLVNANASDLLPQRKWLPENFADLSRFFLKDNTDWIILATGASSETAYVEAVVQAVGSERCLNTAGLFEFEELVSLYQLSSIMLTNDSGPAHFAAVTPLKTFVIFGPETPALYLPLGGNAEAIYLGLPCSPCVSAANHRKTSCITRPCITGISVEMVKQKIDTFVANQFPANPAYV
ncbi:MAG: glycosyltransferase family 9 protein, partial [Verrucomicrobia bacterium]|nr:glycosyltransferase family 9 protein [Cytophagales bacterium]